MRLDVLDSGSCERLKAGVHATALGLAIVMGVYNAAAWLRRRQPHLAVNAVLYAALAVWEQQHLTHHLAKLHPREESEPDMAEGTRKPTVAA